MEIYLIKVNLSLILFYLCYKLLFQRDTFWMLRRVYLLVSVLFSFVYPLISVEGWIRKQEPIMTAIASIQLDEFVITPNEAAQSSLFTLENVLWGIFGMIAVLMLARMILQLISILRKRSRGTKSELQGVPIIRMYDKLMPFSFFQWIFINPLLHTHSEAEEILEHEQTHVRQWHSMDVIIGQVQTMLCWFNPAAWLMEREIRINLEFLADNQVIRSGFEPKKYQYHLLSLTYEPADSKLGNQFNVSPIKKRIKMMNSKKTRKTGLLKYALIIPIALVMLVMSNLQDMIAATKNFVENVVTNEINATQIAEPSVLPNIDFQKPAKEILVFKAPEKKNDPDLAEQKTDKDLRVFEIVEQPPAFPGGEMEMYNWLSENIKYPAEAQAKKIQGRVTMQFIVSETGKIIQPRVVRGIDPLLDAEAVRLISSMPDWIPGKQGGKVVNVRYTLPIQFKLTETGNLENQKRFVPDKPYSGPSMYIVEGKEVTKDEFEKLDKGKYKHVAIYRGEDAVKKYGVKAKDGVLVLSNDKLEIQKDMEWSKGKNAEVIALSVHEEKDNNKVYDVVDTPPVFPGGEKALYDWLAKTIIYPVIAQEVGAMGRISVGYVIDENGNITDAKIINTKFEKAVSELTVVAYSQNKNNQKIPKKPTAEDIKAGEKALEKEALRVIQAMPRWIPGKDKGKNVKVNYVMPIQFKLQ